MVFYPPEWVPQLPMDPPDSITIEEFINDEKHGRAPLSSSRNPYTSGITGKTYTPQEVKARTGFVARALSQKLGFAPNDGTPWDKVVAVYSVNTIDYVPVTHAVHRLSGIVTPASAAYSARELEHQLRSSGAKALFTCEPLLKNALAAADAAGIPRDKVFVLEVADEPGPSGFVSVQGLVAAGRGLPELEPLRWAKGQGARQTAYLCYSSGTSGLPKAVMISHRNVIANVLQYVTHESVGRKLAGVETQVSLGLLPFSHIYALVVVTHGSTYRGDGVVVLPRFELDLFLQAAQRFKIEHMCLVPPIVIQMLRNPEKCSRYDLSSLRVVYTGAAPLGAETAEDLQRQYPKLCIGQGYGMTETATVVFSSSEHDIFFGSSGSLVPGCKAKIIDFDGNEVTALETPGELYVQSPSVTLGYLNNAKATEETFVWHDDGRWIRTGDEVLVRRAPSGVEHFVVVDRIKELIKVKGHQVAPAELEAHLLTHPCVTDCAVIQVPDERAGEVPKAFVVRSGEARGRADEAAVAREISRHVEEHKARYKWIKGGIEFVDVIPKSPSGKILRRLLRDREREARRAGGSRL